MHTMAARAVWHFGWDCTTIWLRGHGQAEQGMENASWSVSGESVLNLATLRPARGRHMPLL